MGDHNYYRNNGSTSSNNNNISCNTDIATTIHGTNLDFPNPELFSTTPMSEVPNNEGSMDIILEDLLRDTHAHNNTTYISHPHLNQDFNNNHTTNNYIHLSNEIISSPNEDKSSENDDESTQLVEQGNNKKRVRREKGDNKEAVRRYREKLKAREAALEEEVMKLKASNQELLKRLQGEAAMQDEIYLLKCLLVDIRGRIEGEIRSFRFVRPSDNASSCNGYNDLMNQNHCNAHCSAGAKPMQSRQIIYDQGSKGGESNKVMNLVSEPKTFLNFKRDV